MSESVIQKMLRVANNFGYQEAISLNDGKDPREVSAAFEKFVAAFGARKVVDAERAQECRKCAGSGVWATATCDRCKGDGGLYAILRDSQWAGAYGGIASTPDAGEWLVPQGDTLLSDAFLGIPADFTRAQWQAMRDEIAPKADHKAHAELEAELAGLRKVGPFPGTGA